MPFCTYEFALFCGGFDVAALTVEDDKLVDFTYYPSAF